MKSTGFLCLLIGACALTVPTGLAGEYHYGETLYCSECHTMHNSMQHTSSGVVPVPETGQPGGDWLATGGPRDHLLKAGGSDLCLACHDGQTFAPDVMGINANAYVREGGALTSGEPPYEDGKGHTLGQSFRPPGGSSSITLECRSCHAAHGHAGYRNLGGNGAYPPLISYAKGTNDLNKDVFLRDFTIGDLRKNYGVDSVDFNEPSRPDFAGSAMSFFCQGCHTRFHGAAGDTFMGGADGTKWLRHPTADANIGQFEQDGEHVSLELFRTRLFRVKVMSPTGDWGTQGSVWTNPPGGLTPMCLTCHKAHGNQNPFGLVLASGTQPFAEEGDAGTNPTLGHGLLCILCHVQ